MDNGIERDKNNLFVLYRDRAFFGSSVYNNVRKIIVTFDYTQKITFEYSYSLFLYNYKKEK